MKAAQKAAQDAKAAQVAADAGDPDAAAEAQAKAVSGGGGGDGGGALSSSDMDNAGDDGDGSGSSPGGPLGGGGDEGGGGGGSSSGSKKGGKEFKDKELSGKIAGAESKGGVLIDAKGASEVKDAHDDGTMRGSEENQRMEPTTGLGYPFAGASMLLEMDGGAATTNKRRFRHASRRHPSTTDLSTRSPTFSFEQRSRKKGRNHRYRSSGHHQRSLLMLDEDNPANQKLLDPASLKGTSEDPDAPENLPYTDPRVIANYPKPGDPLSAKGAMSITDMYICINEDNFPLAEALFLNIASKDVDVKCELVGSTGQPVGKR